MPVHLHLGLLNKYHWWHNYVASYWLKNNKISKRSIIDTKRKNCSSHSRIFYQCIHLFIDNSTRSLTSLYTTKMSLLSNKDKNETFVIHNLFSYGNNMMSRRLSPYPLFCIITTYLFSIFSPIFSVHKASISF